jgi:hypothetical protein
MRAIPAMRAAALALALAFAALPPAAAQVLSGKDLLLFPPAELGSTFRFLPGGLPQAFDRSILLSAAPGEEREYQLQVGSEKDGPGQLTRYLIDKRRPPAPRAEPGTGLYREARDIRLSAESGATIFWALIGPDKAPPSFVVYDEARPPRLEAPSSGTVSYSLLAYAVDRAGNRSYPTRNVYRLAEPGLPASPPAADSSTFTADPLLKAPELHSSPSFVELGMRLPAGASLLLDIQPQNPPQSLDDFERITPEEGLARLRLPCPYGWLGELRVYFGTLKDGIAVYNPQSLSVSLSNPAEETPPPAPPEDPILSSDPYGRASYAIFPSYDGDIFASLDGAPPSAEGSVTKPYSSPLLLPPGARSVQISWYGVSPSGRRSSQRSLLLLLPQSLPEVSLTGMAQGGVSADPVMLRPTASALLRYEITFDGSSPPEPGPSSPVLGEGLSLTCPPGEEQSVVLRYRAFQGEVGGEGRILRFTLDRKPPEVPALLAMPSSYSDRPAVVSLVPGEGGSEVFASVSADGAPAPFVSVTGNLELPGSDAGPVNYLVRAYDVDAAGNRSAEMKSLALVVDRSSVYAASDSADRGDGSPDRPFRSLDEALAAALRGGKRSVNLRGELELRSPLVSGSDLALRGGFGPRWAREPSSRARISVRVGQGKSAFQQSGASLSLQRIELSAEGAGTGPLFSLADAALAVEDSLVSAQGEGDLLFIAAKASRISVDASKLRAVRANACTIFSSEGSSISLSGSSIVAEKAVRVFGAFDMDGGELALRQSLVDSRADLALSLLSLRSSKLLVDRCLVKAEGGSGFLRLGSFAAVSGEIRNSKLLLSWKGAGTLFEISGGGPSFRHDSILADPQSAGLRFFDVRGKVPELWNSIMVGPGKGSELLRSDSPVGQGILVADCLWGFDRLLSGAREVPDIQALNALNADSALYSSKPIISESPEKTFAAPVKSQAALRPDSGCVNAALPLEGGYETDFSGHRRPSQGGPSIGADESTG